jgi:integrase
MGKYIRYLKQATPANKTLTFQRRWPSSLADAAKAAGHPMIYHYPTKCPVNGDAYEQAQAQRQGLAAYDKQVAILKLVAKSADSGLTIVGTAKLPAKHQRALQRAGIRPTRGGRVLSKRKAKALVENSHTLFDLYPLWLAQKPDLTKKAKADRDRYWREWCSFIPDDEAVTAKTIRTIHRAFNDYTEDMLSRGLTPATVERARGSIRSVLRWSSRKLNLGWTIELQQLPKHTAASKPVLDPDQQRALLDAVVSHEGKTAAMVALMLAGGVMTSEIARLDPDEALRTLSTAQPYIVIGANADVKAEARRRIVPIVWSAEVLKVMRTYLPAAIKRSATTVDPSVTVNNWMKARGIGTTGHGLRHTLAVAATVSGVNPLSLARIGGWHMAGGGVSKIMLSYGRGIDDSELVTSLTADARIIWGHLL